LGKEPKTFDEIAKLWGVLEFGLSFEDRYKKKLINT